MCFWVHLERTQGPNGNKERQKERRREGESFLNSDETERANFTYDSNDERESIAMHVERIEG